MKNEHNLSNWGVWEHYTHEVEIFSDGDLVQVSVEGSVRDADLKKLEEGGWVHNNNNVFTMWLKPPEKEKPEKEKPEKTELY